MVEKCLHCERDATTDEQTCAEHSPRENAKAMLNAGAALGVVAIVAIWLPAVAVCIAGIGIGIAVLYFLFRPLRKRDQRKVAERLERRRLIANADREHQLAQKGDIDGVYGAYAPPPEVAGMGMWTTDKDDDKARDKEI